MNLTYWNPRNFKSNFLALNQGDHPFFRLEFHFHSFLATHAFLRAAHFISFSAVHGRVHLNPAASTFDTFDHPVGPSTFPQYRSITPRTNTILMLQTNAYSSSHLRNQAFSLSFLIFENHGPLFIWWFKWWVPYNIEWFIQKSLLTIVPSYDIKAGAALKVISYLELVSWCFWLLKFLSMHFKFFCSWILQEWHTITISLQHFIENHLQCEFQTF